MSTEEMSSHNNTMIDGSISTKQSVAYKGRNLTFDEQLWIILEKSLHILGQQCTTYVQHWRNLVTSKKNWQREDQQWRNGNLILLIKELSIIYIVPNSAYSENQVLDKTISTNNYTNIKFQLLSHKGFIIVLHQSHEKSRSGKRRGATNVQSTTYAVRTVH